MDMGEGFLTVTSSPHVWDKDSVERLMYSVLLALVPACLAGVYFFGLHALALMLGCMAAACLAEAAAQAARRRPLTLRDGSALITGLLLALNLPPGLPLWMGMLGAAVAILLGKQAFGGLGANPFNPALVGRVFLAATFPAAMTSWQPLGGALADTVTTATPLALYKIGRTLPPLSQLFLGSVPGSLGETSALALLAGGLFLIWRQVIDWRIPASYLGTVAVLTALLGQNPLFHLLAGGLMLGAFFMATDLVTSPVTPAGRWLFGIGAGVIVVAVRLFGTLPEGVSYSILFMNGLTPWLNRWTAPRPFGEVRLHA
ncbi:MAG TPA: RnfABCDGE type electron transport complex subunit D [Firmicutes bacterium]|nr:RnfABCDGE type electron transport complex subunit D [Bacillota bacterium]